MTSTGCAGNWIRPSRRWRSRRRSVWRNIAVGIVVVSFTFLGPRTAYTATATFGAVADTHADLKADNTNFGTFSVNTVGLTFESFGPSTLSSVDRGLLHFDISALPAIAVIT